jgi:hypothetical protein
VYEHYFKLQAHAGRGKTQLLHQIAHLWAEQQALHTIDLLLLLRREDINSDTFEHSIKHIIGEHNFTEYKQMKEDRDKRIVILVDGYDEMNERAATELRTFVNQPRECDNLVFVITTRRHKTDEIVSSGYNQQNWCVLCCHGLADNSVVAFFNYLACTEDDRHKVSAVQAQLERIHFEHIPLFILIAWELCAHKDVDINTTLDRYALMRDFCNLQLEKYYDTAVLKTHKLEQFYNTLGWYAIRSETVEPIKTQKSLLRRQQHFTDTLQEEIDKKAIPLMDTEEMFAIACNIGLISWNYTNENRYTFTHKTVAEYAVAQLLYNTQLWTVADSLCDEKWSMIHYYLLMHSIYTNSDGELWAAQLMYSFKHCTDWGSG